MTRIAKMYGYSDQDRADRSGCDPRARVRAVPRLKLKLNRPKTKAGHMDRLLLRTMARRLTFRPVGAAVPTEFGNRVITK